MSNDKLNKSSVQDVEEYLDLIQKEFDLLDPYRTELVGYARYTGIKMSLVDLSLIKVHNPKVITMSPSITEFNGKTEYITPKGLYLFERKNWIASPQDTTEPRYLMWRNDIPAGNYLINLGEHNVQYLTYVDIGDGVVAHGKSVHRFQDKIIVRIYHYGIIRKSYIYDSLASSVGEKTRISWSQDIVYDNFGDLKSKTFIDDNDILNLIEYQKGQRRRYISYHENLIVPSTSDRLIPYTNITFPDVKDHNTIFDFKILLNDRYQGQEDLFTKFINGWSSEDIFTVFAIGKSNLPVDQWDNIPTSYEVNNEYPTFVSRLGYFNIHRISEPGEIQIITQDIFGKQHNIDGQEYADLGSICVNSNRNKDGIEWIKYPINKDDQILIDEKIIISQELLQNNIYRAPLDQDFALLKRYWIDGIIVTKDHYFDTISNLLLVSLPKVLSNIILDYYL